MAHVLRMTYNKEELESASQTSRKMTDLGSLRHDFDSGFGAEETASFGETEALSGLRSKLFDSEKQDSGLGREPESDDEIETDRVVVEPEPPKPLPTPRAAARVAERRSPRRPKKIINPGRSSSMQYVSPSQPSSASATPSMPDAAFPNRTVPALAEEEVQRMYLEKQWRLIQLQQQLNYLLPNKEGDTGIHLAVIHSRPDILNQLLSLVASDARLRATLDEQNCLYQTALHLSVHTQQMDMTQKLLSAGASLELTDHKGNSPLHIACSFSSTKCLDEILHSVPVEKVIEVSCIRNHQGQTCVHVATEHGNTDTLRRLKAIGVDMNMEDFHSGKTPLHLAIEKCSLTDVQFLTETCQVDFNKPTYSGCTPLHTAAGRGNIAMVAYLLSMGADPELETDEGDSPLDLAGSEQVAAILTKAAALQWL